MKSRTPLLALAAGTAAILALAGCSTASNDAGSEGPLRVVATTTQLTDFAHQVGGDDIELTGLLTAGASAHHFDPSPADLLALGEADVLIVNGAGLETFVDSAVEASGFSGTIVDASQGIDLAEAEAITAEGGGAGDHDHAHEDESADDHAEEDHADHDHAEDDHADHDHATDDHADEEHDHDHGSVNPHIWTSPRLAQGMGHEGADGLATADPANADAFEERAHAYIDQLAALDTWIGAQFERVPAADRVLVSGHDSLTYFLHDYGITFVGSLLPSFEDNAEPSAAEVDALVAAIKEQGVKAVFVESSMSPKLAETVAAEAGVTVVSESALYADSLGTEAGTNTYIGATIHNTVTILEAWGVTPDPLPAELEGL